MLKVCIGQGIRVIKDKHGYTIWYGMTDYYSHSKLTKEGAKKQFKRFLEVLITSPIEAPF